MTDAWPYRFLLLHPDRATRVARSNTAKSADVVTHAKIFRLSLPIPTPHKIARNQAQAAPVQSGSSPIACLIRAKHNAPCAGRCPTDADAANGNNGIGAVAFEGRDRLIGVAADLRMKSQKPGRREFVPASKSIEPIGPACLSRIA